MVPVNKMKPRLAADTCSLIFMYQTGLLDRAAEQYTLYITPLLLGELEKRADKKELRKYRQLTVVYDLDGVLVAPVTVPNASHADKSLIALYHAINGAAVLSEDGPILRYCKKNNIPHFCCLSLVADMVRKNALSRDMAIDYFNKLKTFGRYAEWVIETAYNMLEGK